MDPTQYQQLLEQKRQTYGQQIANTSYNPASTMSDQEYQQLRKTKDQKILELYEHDKALANNYANPQSESYLNDPYARELARANRGKATAGEILDIGRSMSDREAAIEQTNMQEQQRRENEMKMAQYEMALLQNQFENALKIQQVMEAQKEKAAEEEAFTLFNQLVGQAQEAPAKVAASKVPSVEKITVAKKPSVTDFKTIKGVKIAKTAEAAKVLALQKKHPGASFSFEKNKDGTYTYSVVPKGATFVTNNEIAMAKDPNTYVKGKLSQAVAKNPKMGKTTLALLDQLIPKQETFGSSQSEVAAGVAEMPKTAETMEKYQNYLANKDMILKTEQPWLKLGPLSLGGGQYMINKQTGQKTKIDASSMPFVPSAFASGLGGIPSYFIPD